jgi:hypothetical protein
MSTTNSTSGIHGLSNLAAQLFNRVDANNDGTLSKNEFQSFLESLLHKIDTGQTSGLGSESAAVSPAGAGGSASRVYQPMLGFDYTKLNDPGHTTPKYVFARATQDLDFAWDRASRSAGLQNVADYAKAHGYPDTKVTGDDTMDFGDGNGDIDVLTGDGQWWWGPQG